MLTLLSYRGMEGPACALMGERTGPKLQGRIV